MAKLGDSNRVKLLSRQIRVRSEENSKTWILRLMLKSIVVIKVYICAEFQPYDENVSL